MDYSALLLINEDKVSVEQAFRYLVSAGKLRSFINEIINQYVLDQELGKLEGDIANPGMVEQAIIDFRMERNLTDQKAFQQWLAGNNLDFPTFYNQTAYRLKRDTLKSAVSAQITEQQVQEYFVERKVFLDRVVLSRIIVNNRELAEELKIQSQEGADFGSLAQEYSIAEDRIAKGMMGIVSRMTLPEKLRSAIDSAKVGDVVGPLDLDKYWGLYKIEQNIPASLEDERLKQRLQDELFERWLAEKIQKMNVKLQIK